MSTGRHAQISSLIFVKIFACISASLVVRMLVYQAALEEVLRGAQSLMGSCSDTLSIPNPLFLTDIA
jgi:hypothetical protein